MEFSRYPSCPPRAPLGRQDAVYGSFDHLILLLARIADFACRDRARKLRQVELNGGVWRPPPGMKMPQPPPQAPPTPQSANGAFPHNPMEPHPHPYPPPAANQSPAFYGMAPPPRENVHLPGSYNPLNGSNRAVPHAAPPPPVDAHELHVATEAAKLEYGQLRAALMDFQNSLGDAFQPLTPDLQPPTMTPFGFALFYRSYDIGCLWAVYYMAVIIAIRSQPHMPPAAHMAAGVAAADTAFFANEIGRIAAGIVPGPPGQDLNPSLGAALCESCMPCFFAAIQYQEKQQRHSTVTRIYEIAHRTGWGSAELIANGCETAWVKAAAAGRGPQYTRVVRRENSDDPRLNGSWENLDMNTMPDGRDDRDRRLVRVRPDARLNWAFGIMGTEEDVRLVE
jgi:hypothetical protein